jgi:hypothetical protein
VLDEDLRVAEGLDELLHEPLLAAVRDVGHVRDVVMVGRDDHLPVQEHAQ